MPRKNRVYLYEIKLEVAKRFLAGESKTALMSEFNIRNDTQVENWARLLRDGGTESLKPKKRGRRKQTTEQTELEQLRMENEILKKIQDLLEQEKP